MILNLAKRQFFHIALVGFPGVVLHELTHLIVGIILLAKPVALNLIPRRAANQWHFGSVSFTGLNLFNAAPVALAPLLLLGVAWFSLHLWMLPLVAEHHYWGALGCGYLTACALFYSIPSITDLRIGGLSFLLWLTVILAAIYFWGWPQSLTPHY